MKTFQSTSKCRHILIAGMLAWGVLPILQSPMKVIRFLWNLLLNNNRKL